MAAEVPAQSQPFTPRLSLDVATRYNDNLLIDSITKIKDFSEVLSPEVGFRYGQPKRTYIDLDYRAEFVRNFTYKKYDANNQFITLGTQAEFDHGIIKLRHSFQDVSSPSYEVSGITREQLNQTIVNGEYRLNSKNSAGLNYNQDFHTWLTPGLIDYQQFVVGGTFYYHLFSKTDLLGQFKHGWVNLDRGANAVYEEPNVGLRGQLTSKITGLATVGYQHREYAAGVVPSLNEPVTSIELDAKLTDRTTVSLLASRIIEPSVEYLNVSYVKNCLDLTVEHRLHRTVMMSVGGGYFNAKDLSDVTAGNHMRKQITGQLGITYDLTKRIQFRAKYQHLVRNNTILCPVEQNAFSLHVMIHY